MAPAVPTLFGGFYSGEGENSLMILLICLFTVVVKGTFLRKRH